MTKSCRECVRVAMIFVSAKLVNAQVQMNRKKGGHHRNTGVTEVTGGG